MGRRRARLWRPLVGVGAPILVIMTGLAWAGDPQVAAPTNCVVAAQGSLIRVDGSSDSVLGAVQDSYAMTMGEDTMAISDLQALATMEQDEDTVTVLLAKGRFVVTKFSSGLYGVTEYTVCETVP